MSADTDIIARTTALAMPLGEVQARRMFGGFGLYLDGAMFALVARGALYLKADGETTPQFESAGTSPFTYNRKGKDVSLSFRTLPGGAFDDMDAFLPWAELAVGAARRAKRARKPGKEKKRARSLRQERTP